MKTSEGWSTRRVGRVVNRSAGLAALVVAALWMGGQQRAGVEREAVMVRFASVDVYVDCGAARLGAWQVDVARREDIGQGEPAQRVRLVGVEGGEAGAFEAPAYYDPEALMSERIKLAAFSVMGASGLPTGKTRVARLHVQIERVGEAGSAVFTEPRFDVRLTVAADGEGNPIDGAASASVKTQTEQQEQR